MMQFFFIALPCLFLSSCSAYDNFQGLFRLASPCFPAFDHSECNTTLVEMYDPPIEKTSSNPLTTMFFLFTPKSQDTAEQLHQCRGGLPSNSTFDSNCPTEVFIHGYLDGVCRTAWMREMKEQMFLRNNCYNVILVDWTWGNLPEFSLSAVNAKIAGTQVGYVLNKIARQTGYDCSKFHIIGHSFGAAAASYAGKSMEKKCKLGRLTALDDSLTPFYYTPISEYLNPNDAILVDTVHTDSGDCFPFTVGNPRPLGHVNFYMNDGTHQYSCYPYAFQSLLKLDILYAWASIFIPPFCAHLQAIQYYKASILANTDNTLLIGVQCPCYEDFKNGNCERNCKKEGTCLPMGYDTPSYLNYSNLSNDLCEAKVYYVPTTMTCPYADHSGFTGLPLTPVNEQDLSV